MYKLQSSLEAVIKAIPECLAVGCINISNGELLGIKTEKSQLPTVNASLIKTLADLFNDSNASLVKDIFSALSYEGSFFKKLVINFNNLFYIFMSVREEEAVSFFICPLSVDLDAVLLKATNSMVLIKK